MILDGRELEFYKYNGDYKPFLEDVRDNLNEVASNWSREQKDHCLGETEQSFKVRTSGENKACQNLRCLFQTFFANYLTGT